MELRLNNWDLWNERNSPNYPQEKVVQFVLRNFKKGNQGKKALDVGCGTGIHTQFLAELGFEVYGFDYSIIGVDRTKSRLEKHGLVGKIKQGAIGDIESIFPEIKFFDLIVCSGVLDSAGLEQSLSMGAKIHSIVSSESKGIFIFSSDKDFRVIYPRSDFQLHGYSRLEVEEIFKQLEGRTNIDRYITSYENEKFEQNDWLVTLI